MKPHLFLKSSILFILFSFTITSLLAQEPEIGTPQDNACNEGGVMWRENSVDGCTSDWHWTCGWYMARFSDGRFSREQVPAVCASLLPPLPEPEGGAELTATIRCLEQSPGIHYLIPWSTSLDPTAVDIYINGVLTHANTHSPGSATCTGPCAGSGWVFSLTLAGDPVILASVACP